MLFLQRLQLRGKPLDFRFLRFELFYLGGDLCLITMKIDIFYGEKTAFFFRTHARAISLVKPSKECIRNAQAELTKLQQRQNKLKEEAIKALTGESVYAPEMIQELLASNTEAMNKAEAELQNAEKDRAELDAKLKELVRQYESIHDWAEVFDAAGVDEKKMILSRIIGKITVNRNYDITIYFFLTLDDFKHALAEEGRDNVKVCEEPVRKKTLCLKAVDWFLDGNTGNIRNSHLPFFRAGCCTNCLQDGIIFDKLFLIGWFEALVRRLGIKYGYLGSAQRSHR